MSRSMVPLVLLTSLFLTPLPLPATELPGCDFNGGGDDLAVGVPGEKVTASGEGAVNVIFDGQVVDDEFLHQGTGGIDEDSRYNDRFGEALACGNFNGDGFDDLAIGVPGRDQAGYEDSGAVWVLFGSKEGFQGKSDLVNTPQLWDEVAFLGQSGDRHEFGAELAVGDFDGNGCDDLAIAAPGATVDKEPQAGAVYLLYSNCELGLEHDPDKAWQFSQLMDGWADVPEEGDRFGTALAAGDFDADGFDELVVGVPLEDEQTTQLEDVGAVHVFYGGPNGPFADTQSETETIFQNFMKDGLQADDQFGFSLAVADFDADGLEDLAIGVPFEDVEGYVSVVDNAGAVNVLYGTPCGLVCNQTRWQFWHQDSVLDGEAIDDVAEANDQFGYDLTVADLCTTPAWNSKFLDAVEPGHDLVVGAPGENAGAGQIHLICGSPYELTAGLWVYDLFLDIWFFTFWDQTYDQQLDEGEPAEAGDRFGATLSSRSDGLAIDIGVPGEGTDGATSVGMVETFVPAFGGPVLIPWSQADPDITDEAETDDRFGTALP